MNKRVKNIGREIKNVSLTHLKKGDGLLMDSDCLIAESLKWLVSLNSRGKQSKHKEVVKNTC